MTNLKPDDKNILIGYLNRMDKAYSDEIFKYEKKDENGNYSISDPAAVGISNSLNNIKKGLAALTGRPIINPDTNGPAAANPLTATQTKFASSLPTPLASHAFTRIVSGGEGVNPAQSVGEALDRIKLFNSNPATRLSAPEQLALIKAVQDYYIQAAPIIQNQQQAIDQDQGQVQSALDAAINEAKTQDMNRAAAHGITKLSVPRFQ